MCTLFGGLVTADISHVSYQDGFWDPCVCVCVDKKLEAADWS